MSIEERRQRYNQAVTRHAVGIIQSEITQYHARAGHHHLLRFSDCRVHRGCIPHAQLTPDSHNKIAYHKLKCLAI